jgi:hypothetical protein
VLETNGSLLGVALVTAPGSGGAAGAREPVTVSGWYGVPASGRFTLIDDSGPGVPRTLYSCDPYTGRFPVMNRPAGAGIPFGNLRVASCPASAQVTVTTA